MVAASGTSFGSASTPLRPADGLTDGERCLCEGDGAELLLAPSPTRWWILTIFALLSQAQALTWNFYGPISNQVELIKGWPLGKIAWLANIANIVMMPGVPMSASLVHRLGLRYTTLACAALLAGCAALRCVPPGPSPAPQYAVGVLSMLCNGAAAGWLTFGGPVLSAAWFPAMERGMATAIMSVSPFIGQSVGFIIGPMVVPEGLEAPAAFRNLCFGEAAVCSLLLAAVAGHFPERPVLPPSRVAATRARPTAPGKAWRRLSLVVAFSALPNGVFGGWVPVLTPNLAEFGVSEGEAAWIGCLTTLLGAVGGLAFGRLSDAFPGRLKEMMLVCLTFSTAGFGCFALVATKATAGGVVALCAAGMVGGFFVNALFPLGYELAMETAYPDIPEPQAAAAVLFVNTAVQVTFLAVCSDLAGSSKWMNWLNVAASACLLLPLALFRARYPRLAVDGLRASEPASH